MAINKGVQYLQSQQQPDGSWSNPEHPALTALPLVAILRQPAEAKQAEAAPKALAYIRGKAKPDGGIYEKGLSNYNTSICMMALLAGGDPKDAPLIAKARDFVVDQQASNMVKPELNGGIGYGPTGVSPKRAHPDLDNTLIALEALRAAKEASPTAEKAKDLDWQAAINFITRCQNLPSHNKEPWASGDVQNKGGFVYYPGFSNAGEAELPDGKKALRSYGTMTYGGLLSFIYADLKKDDPRVSAAVDWLQSNYTLEENPGMGRQGLYYYYHLMAKGLAAADVDSLATSGGKSVDWKRELALKLINLQSGDGSWVNDTARWMEKDPVLVTTYCVIALKTLYSVL